MTLKLLCFFIGILSAADEGYFKVSIPAQPSSLQVGLATQSFVVRISNPQQLIQVRELLKHPPYFVDKVLIGEIAKGDGSYNAPWRWHLHRVKELSDFASIECDASPEVLEANLEDWLQLTPLYCPWSYRIVEEVRVETAD